MGRGEEGKGEGARGGTLSRESLSQNLNSEAFTLPSQRHYLTQLGLPGEKVAAQSGLGLGIWEPDEGTYK